MRSHRFSDKVAIVTGGGSGFGKAFCQALAAEGASVVCVDIRKERAEETANIIADSGGRAMAVETDVSSSKDVEMMVSEAIRKFRHIDILINNAGVTYRFDLLDTTEEQWDHVLDVDLKGLFLVTKAVVPHMIKQQYGKIVNISSICGVTGVISTAYTAAKAGVIGLTRKLCQEFLSHNIYVNCIAPGFIATPLNEAFRKTAMGKAIDAKIPGGYGKIENIVPPVLFLCSSEADYISGQCIAVDGGLTATHDLISEFRQ